MIGGRLSAPHLVQCRLPRCSAGREVVPDLAVVAPVVQRIDMRAAVGVHREHVAGIADLLVDLAGLPGQVVDHRAGRGVRHPDLVGRVAGRDPGRHPHEVFDRQVIDARRVDPREDALARVRGDQVEAADLVVGAVGTGADGVAGHGCEVHGVPLLAKVRSAFRASAQRRRSGLAGARRGVCGWRSGSVDVGVRSPANGAGGIVAGQGLA